MHPVTKTVAGIAAALLAASPVAACGGDDGDTSAGPTTTATGTGAGEGGSTLEVLAKDSLKFDRDAYDAEAGTVRFVYENDGNLPHTLLIDGVNGFKLKVSTKGETDEGEVELEPGTYELFCDVPGHQGAGMEASLTVE